MGLAYNEHASRRSGSQQPLLRIPCAFITASEPTTRAANSVRFFQVSQRILTKSGYFSFEFPSLYEFLQRLWAFNGVQSEQPSLSALSCSSPYKAHRKQVLLYALNRPLRSNCSHLGTHVLDVLTRITQATTSEQEDPRYTTSSPSSKGITCDDDIANISTQDGLLARKGGSGWKASERSAARYRQGLFLCGMRTRVTSGPASFQGRTLPPHRETLNSNAQMAGESLSVHVTMRGPDLDKFRFGYDI